MTRFKDLSLQAKIAIVYILSSLMILIINLALLVGINYMSDQLDATYNDNLFLSDVRNSISAVQEDMTEFLNVKTTDSLENYYLSEQRCRDNLDKLSSDATSLAYDRMQRNIRNMSDEYLEIVSQTIEAKRGRNVEKYRARYESATELYGYIDSYITSLNTQQFEVNSKEYSNVSQMLRIIQNTSLLVMIAVITMNAVVIINYTGRLIKPLKDLSLSANEVARGNLDIELKEVDSEDEIGVVTKAFNSMVISIRDYIKKVRISMETERRLKEKELMMETHLKDAQIKYLQAQINPHFLFNSLNAGAQLSMMEGADKTYEYIQAMAEFFRYNIKKNNDPITLDEEISLVDNYIYIINVRFSGDVKFVKDIDESLLGVYIPSMILQPIVENCVNHGIREMDGKGIITLSVFSEDNHVCISVKDNGKGISQDKIAEIINGTYSDPSNALDSNGIGMVNVINRLRLFLDYEDVMTILSEGEGKGTEFKIFLPLIRDDR